PPALGDPALCGRVPPRVARGPAKGLRPQRAAGDGRLAGARRRRNGLADAAPSPHLRPVRAGRARGHVPGSPSGPPPPLSAAMPATTPRYLMTCCASRALEDGRPVAVGTGVPCAAAMLAQRTHAPRLTILFEAGGVAPRLPTMPISVGDSRTFYRACMATSM